MTQTCPGCGEGYDRHDQYGRCPAVVRSNGAATFFYVTFSVLAILVVVFLAARWYYDATHCVTYFGSKVCK